MNISSLLGGGGGGGEGAPMTGASGVGGTGKGASGAANFTGDNSAVFGNKGSDFPWGTVGGVAAVLVLGLFAWKLSRD